MNGVSALGVAVNDRLAVGIDVGMATSAVALLAATSVPSPDDVFIRWWETESTQGESPTAARGRFRRNRRRLKRAGQRRQAARALLRQAGLPAEAAPLGLGKERCRELDDLGVRRDIFGLRALAVREDGRLSPAELVAVLIHCIGHRGWKPSSKADLVASGGPRSNAPEGAAVTAGKDADDDGKMKSAIEAMDQRLSLGYRSLGDLLGRIDAEGLPRDRRRNRSGDYLFVARRDHVVAEIRAIGRAQGLAEEVVEALAGLCEDQKIGRALPPFPCKLLGDREDLAEEEKWRAHANHPSFEAFRFVQGLNNLSITNVSSGIATKLLRPRSDAETPGENLPPRIVAMRRQALEFLARCPSDKVTYADMRKVLALGEDEAFTMLLSAAAKAVQRKLGKGGSTTPAGIAKDIQGIQRKLEKDRVFADMSGTRAFREIFGAEIFDRPSLLDRCAAIVLDMDDLTSIHRGLERLDGLSVGQRHRAAARLDLFAFTRRRGHLCPAAARLLLPHLAEGWDYGTACGLAGVEVPETAGIDAIGDPAVRRAVAHVLDLFAQLVERLGVLPGRVVVETGRDLARSPKQRDEKRRDQWIAEKRTRQHGDLYRAEVGEAPPRGFGLRVRLWEQQHYFCPYCGGGIGLRDLGPKGGNPTQIDHILHKAGLRDSRDENLVLVHARCNQGKTTHSAVSFIARGGAEAVEEYRNRVRAMGLPYGKVRRLLADDDHADGFLKDGADQVKTALANGNSWVAKVVMAELARLYPKDGRRHVFAAPGRVTSLLRRALGVEDLKHLETGERRRDDRTHGVDAMVLALVATDPQRLAPAIVRAVQEVEPATGGEQYKVQQRAEIEAVKTVAGRVLAEAGWSPVADPERFAAHLRNIWERFTVDRRYAPRRVDGALHKETSYGYECFDWLPVAEALPLLASGRGDYKGAAVFDGLMKQAVAESLKPAEGVDGIRSLADLQADLVTHVQAEIAARLDGAPPPELPGPVAETLLFRREGGLYRKPRKGEGGPVLSFLPLKVAQRPGDSETGLVPPGEFRAFSSESLSGLHAAMVDAARKGRKGDARGEMRKKWQGRLAALRDPWRNRALFDTLRDWFLDQEGRILATLLGGDGGTAATHFAPPVFNGRPIHGFATEETMENALVIRRGGALVLVRSEGILAVSMRRQDGEWTMRPTYRFEAAIRRGRPESNMPALPERISGTDDEIVLYPGDLVEMIDGKGKAVVGYLSTVDVGGNRLYLDHPLSRDKQKVSYRNAGAITCLRPVVG
ncbi:MAG: HNH endonuclease [Magnetospirillum sp.]|nr:HNH endonuclease [Magnetospirillum sp.]